MRSEAKQISLQSMRDSEMISLVTMSYVIAVADMKSFTAAANSLGVKQSTVSRRIRSLEDDIGVALFERETTGVRITNAGKIFLQQSAAALDQINQALKSAANAGGGIEGEIRLGIEAPLSEDFLLEVLSDFRAQHENVSLHLIEGSKTEQLRRLAHKEIDFAIVHAKPLGNDYKITSMMFDTQIFWQTKLYIAVPYSHPLANMSFIHLNALKSDRLILGSYCCDDLLNDYKLVLEQGLSQELSIEKICVGREALMNMVGLGLGVTFTTEAGATRQYKGVAIRPLQGAIDKLHYRGVWCPQNDNPAFRRFLSLARSKAVMRKSA